VYIEGKFVLNFGSLNRKHTIADWNNSLSDEQSERRWKKNVGIDGKERQRYDEKK